MKIYLTNIFKLQISFAGVDGCNTCRCTKLSPPYKGGISACTKYFFFFLFLASFFFLIDQIVSKTQCLCDEDDLDFKLEDDFDIDLDQHHHSHHQPHHTHTHILLKMSFLFLMLVMHHVDAGGTAGDDTHFLSDPGVPGVRSLGPDVCPSQTDVCET